MCTEPHAESKHEISHDLKNAKPLFGGGWDAFGLSKASLLNHAMAWLKRLTA